LSGNVLADKMEIPEYGWMGVVQDPTGAVFGIWQAMEDSE
jgi:predicted enzyme related to lactoylglutathione lyase